MSKRDIVVLIAGGLLSTQVGWAAAGEGMSLYAAEENIGTMTPATVEYLQQRAANYPPPRADGSVWPKSGSSTAGGTTPATIKYLAQRAKDIAPGGPRVVSIGASTPYINVEHLQTVKIVNDKGQSFVWEADTPAAGANHFALKDVVPNGFVAGATAVFLSHPYAHTSAGN